MFPRIAIIATLILPLLLLPGCPVNSELVGLWTVILTVEFQSDVFEWTLNADGTGTFFLIDGTPVGNLTWEAAGDKITVYRDTSVGSVAYIGTVNNGVASGGFVNWIGPETGSGGSWSAEKQ